MKPQSRPIRRPSQSGMSLIETMIALGILLVASAGILPIGMIAVETTENQGHLTARTTEYAQDKMEQLMALAWGDTVTDTTQFPPCGPATTPSCTTGTGLAVGGSSDPTAPVTSPGNGYVDYLDVTGNPSTVSGNWFYIRVWQISNPAGSNNCVVQGASVPCLKQITVTAKVRSQVGAPQGGLPQSTISSLKTTPF